MDLQVDAASLGELLGLEGNGARLYSGAFAGMIKTGETVGFDFNARNRRPPRDPVNALLSLAYSLLSKDLTIACAAVGFDPMMGFYRQPRFGRPALALDLLEPFRPLIAESVVLTAINTRMVTERDFVRAGRAVALTPNGRRGLFQAYEARMDTLVTHPVRLPCVISTFVGAAVEISGQGDRRRAKQVHGVSDSIARERRVEMERGAGARWG